MLRRRSRPAPDVQKAAPAPPTKSRPHARTLRAALTRLALVAALAAAWVSRHHVTWPGLPSFGPPSDANPSSPRVTPAEAAAAAAELAAAAAPVVGEGASGYVSADEWGRIAFNETEFRGRAARAVRGAFVADAATLGLHGAAPVTIQRLLSAAGKDATPEFWTPHAGPYEADPGSFSAHGYEVLPLLQSLLGANNFSSSHYAAAAVAFFASTPGRVEPLPATWAAAAAAALQVGRSAARLGLDSPAASAVVKVPTLVARYGGTPRLRPCLGGAVAVHQTCARARAAAGAAAAVLERVLVLRESVPEAVAAASECDALSATGRAMLKAGLERAKKGEKAPPPPPHPHGATAEHALATALDAALAHPSDYVAAVRAAMLAGGDAAAPRAHLVGAWLAAAAADGDDASPPAAWKAKAIKSVSVDAMVHLLLHQRGQAVPVAMPGQAVDGEEVGRV